MLFDWYFSSTILTYLLVDAVSGHCNAVRAFESLIFHKECQYFERGIPSSYLRQAFEAFDTFKDLGPRMAVGQVNAAPIARPLCRSSVDTTPHPRGPRQVVAAGV